MPVRVRFKPERQFNQDEPEPIVEPDVIPGETRILGETSDIFERRVTKTGETIMVYCDSSGDFAEITGIVSQEQTKLSHVNPIYTQTMYSLTGYDIGRGVVTLEFYRDQPDNEPCATEDPLASLSAEAEVDIS